MEKSCQMAQLMLRISLSLGFLLASMDRVGFLGGPGESNVAWGDWASFAVYTHQLMPYVSLKTASFFGLVATVLEVVVGMLLIVGYKIRYAAWVSFGLTLLFALSMMFFLSFRAPFNYSVFVVSIASLLLATFPRFSWSVDSYIKRG